MFYIWMNIGEVTELYLLECIIFRIQCWNDFFFWKRFRYHTEQFSWLSVKLFIWFIFCCFCLFVCCFVFLHYNYMHSCRFILLTNYTLSWYQLDPYRVVYTRVSLFLFQFKEENVMKKADDNPILILGSTVSIFSFSCKVKSLSLFLRINKNKTFILFWFFKMLTEKLLLIDGYALLFTVTALLYFRIERSRMASLCC